MRLKITYLLSGSLQIGIDINPIWQSIEPASKSVNFKRFSRFRDVQKWRQQSQKAALDWTDNSNQSQPLNHEAQKSRFSLFIEFFRMIHHLYGIISNPYKLSLGKISICVGSAISAAKGVKMFVELLRIQLIVTE